MNKMNDPIENVVNGFVDGFSEDKEETARLKFWGVVLVAAVAAGAAFIYFM